MSDQALLARLARGPASGAALAAELGITRSAVWKRIESLRAAGVDVAATPGRGYALARTPDLLDAEKIQAALAPATRERLAGLELHFDIDSTNAEALRHPAPATGVQAWLAERQTAGRGRRGRTWVSPLAAHVYLSLSRRFDAGIGALQGLSLAVGAATAEVLHAKGFPQVGLKWPNDLLADGRKLGGILVELRGDAAGPLHVVVGLGLNVAMPAPAAAGIDQPWCDLASLAPNPPGRSELCAGLLDALVPLLADYENAGLKPWQATWSRLDLLAGRPVRLEEGGRSIDGIALGIDGEGALRLRTADGERRCHAGETSLRAA
ncbi:bifunctional biotin--[acetyl-CoA-carboxylase] ligase/biotin operon repressor BirA [Arenimonas sp.]|uniref:bifunctional biotin--[acetyl-CoA-carboxylase] ligase/biotin operon repressor BirA n=1 Tax=Arenimonas sp. TaxID=1872635 RepID=UPI0035B36EDD